MDYLETWKIALYADEELKIDFIGKKFIGNKEAWTNIAKKSNKQYKFAKKCLKKISSLQRELNIYYPNHKEHFDNCFKDFVSNLKSLQALDFDWQLHPDEVLRPDNEESTKRGPKPYPQILSEYIVILADLCDSIVSAEKNSLKLMLYDYFKPEGEFDLWIKKSSHSYYLGPKFKINSTDSYLKINCIECFFRDQRKRLK